MDDSRGGNTDNSLAEILILVPEKSLSKLNKYQLESVISKGWFQVLDFVKAEFLEENGITR